MASTAILPRSNHPSIHGPSCLFTPLPCLRLIVEAKTPVVVVVKASHSAEILPQFGPEGLQTEFSFSKDIDSSGWVPMYVPHDVYDTANDFVPKLDREEKARLETRRAQLARAREPKKGTLTKLRAAFGKKMKPSDLDIACPNFPFCANVSIFFFLGFHRV